MSRFQRGSNLVGHEIREPRPWPLDNGARREPIIDRNFKPVRVIRHVGHARCLSCTRWFFSRDVLGIRRCDACKAAHTSE